MCDTPCVIDFTSASLRLGRFLLDFFRSVRENAHFFVSTRFATPFFENKKPYPSILLLFLVSGESTFSRQIYFFFSFLTLLKYRRFLRVRDFVR